MVAARSHVFCVPFPGAGHGVNMCNVAHVLATPEIPVHLCLLSRAEGLKWQKATGQATNPNVYIDVLANGKWEGWHTENPQELVQFVRSPEMAQAVSDKVVEVSQKFQNEKMAGMVYNGLMTLLAGVCQQYGLKAFLLNPSPYYMSRIGMANVPEEGDTPDTDIIFKGIGGSDRDLHAKLGDAIELLGPMWNMVAQAMLSADGIIYSNTNTGLEGDLYHQPHMKNNTTRAATEYIIGPILPPWLEHGLDQPSLITDRPASTDPSIEFMSRHPPKSVVYIALGSHGTFTIPQAKLVTSTLTAHSVPWILLCRDQLTQMAEALGPPSSGHITPWAPQLEILTHPSLRCVLSHGGFGTMIEGIFAGAAFITSPITSDQFIDTRVMMHLGICVGTIAENRRIPNMTRSELTPFFPDDGGKGISELFGRIFGSEEGERELESAREAARRLRKRMIDAKNKDGREQMESLRGVIMSRT